nr:hypothetical protein HK105_004333 [Polyrhizophydium stewartii]
MSTGRARAAGGYYYYTQQTEARAKQKAWRNNPVGALDPQAFRPFTVTEVETVNHNTKRIRFALPNDATELGLPTASAVVARFVRGTKPDGKPDVVIRPYTPIEDPAEGYTGHFDLVVKKYPDGAMSSHLHALAPGDKVELKGPIPKFPYSKNEEAHIGMIAGGSGITPMLQVIQRVLSDPADKTKLSLVYANVTEDDIMLRKYLDKLAAQNPEQLKVYYTLDKPPAGWTQGAGFVNEDMIKAHMPAPGVGKVFFCGPPGMMGHVSGPKGPNYTQGEVGGLLKKLGYTTADVFKF